MNISRLLNYKIVDCAACIAIVPEAANVAMSGAEPLIISDMATCCEYLARYTDARSRGLALKESHQFALQGARVLQAGRLDGPGS